MMKQPPSDSTPPHASCILLSICPCFRCVSRRYCANTSTIDYFLSSAIFVLSALSLSAELAGGKYAARKALRSTESPLRIGSLERHAHTTCRPDRWARVRVVSNEAGGRARSIKTNTEEQDFDRLSLTLASLDPPGLYRYEYLSSHDHKAGCSVINADYQDHLLVSTSSSYEYTGIRTSNTCLGR